MAAESTSLSGLAGRYAVALYDLADEKKQLDKIAEELTDLRQVIRDSDDFRLLLRSPLIGRDEKAAAIDAVADKAGLSELVQNFVKVVAKNARLFALPDMIDAFLLELARRRGEVTAYVRTARELDDGQQKALTEALRKAVGGKVNIDVEVDSSLLGGLIVKVGSRMIDNSLRSKLQRLQFAMKGVG